MHHVENVLFRKWSLFLVLNLVKKKEKKRGGGEKTKEGESVNLLFKLSSCLAYM